MTKGKTCSSCKKEDGKEGGKNEVYMKEREKKQTRKSADKRVVRAARGEGKGCVNDDRSSRARPRNGRGEGGREGERHKPFYTYLIIKDA